MSAPRGKNRLRPGVTNAARATRPTHLGVVSGPDEDRQRVQLSNHGRLLLMQESARRRHPFRHGGERRECERLLRARSEHRGDSPMREPFLDEKRLS